VLHSCSYTHLAPVCYASHLSRRPSCTCTVRRPLGPHVCSSLAIYLVPHAWLGCTHSCTALALIRAQAAWLLCTSRVSLTVVPALLLCCSASLHPVARTTTVAALVLPPHMPGSLTHMLARVRACQLRAPNRVASSSSTCERRMSDLWPTLHALMCQCIAPALAPHALRFAARSSCLLPSAHALGHSQPVAAPDDCTRANLHVVAISSCTPNHPPAPLDRSSAHAEVPCLVSLGRPSASVRCDARKTVVSPSFLLSHKKRHHHHHSHL
jgi:hypothetical protein